MGISPLTWGLIETSHSPGLILGLVSSAAWIDAVTARLVRVTCNTLLDARRMGTSGSRPRASALAHDMPSRVKLPAVSCPARPTAPSCDRCGVCRHVPAAKGARPQAPGAAAGWPGRPVILPARPVRAFRRDTYGRPGRKSGDGADGRSAG